MLAAVPLLSLSLCCAEMLVVSDVECPPELPEVACFMRSGAASAERLSGVSMPRDVTVQYVQDLLQDAIKVEHSTVPLYLTTLYSIVDQNSFEAQTMKSVVMEEMLHMVRAANVLNAIGEWLKVCTCTRQAG